MQANPRRVLLQSARVSYRREPRAEPFHTHIRAVTRHIDDLFDGQDLTS